MSTVQLEVAGRRGGRGWEMDVEKGELSSALGESFHITVLLISPAIPGGKEGLEAQSLAEGHVPG